MKRSTVFSSPGMRGLSIQSGSTAIQHSSDAASQYVLAFIRVYQLSEQQQCGSWPGEILLRGLLAAPPTRL
jgi:hypothetical protein